MIGRFDAHTGFVARMSDHRSAQGQEVLVYEPQLSFVKIPGKVHDVGTNRDWSSR
jgi:hypothetical protein